jgi:hypothetical protein
VTHAAVQSARPGLASIRSTMTPPWRHARREVSPSSSRRPQRPTRGPHRLRRATSFSGRGPRTDATSTNSVLPGDMTYVEAAHPPSGADFTGSIPNVVVIPEVS